MSSPIEFGTHGSHWCDICGRRLGWHDDTAIRWAVYAQGGAEVYRCHPDDGEVCIDMLATRDELAVTL